MRRMTSVAMMHPFPHSFSTLFPTLCPSFFTHSPSLASPALSCLNQAAITSCKQEHGIFRHKKTTTAKAAGGEGEGGRGCEGREKRRMDQVRDQSRGDDHAM